MGIHWEQILTTTESIQLENTSGTIINPATEEKQDTNIAILGELRTLNTSIHELAREQARFASLRPSELPYAKTNLDQMRVNVDGGGIEMTQVRFWNSSWVVPTSMYSTGTPNAYDAREMLKIQAGIIAELRIWKWTIS